MTVNQDRGGASVEHGFRLKPAGPGEILVGAAIGLGMTARAAVQGGADFLLVLNAGRLRVMGAASNSALLPIREANSFTDEFARREILGRVSVPVFFGACVMDPALDLDRHIAHLATSGYAGVANFPTAIHLDGQVRASLEAAGLGLAREAAMLAKAREAGLGTIGYVRTRQDLDLMMDAGVDMLCVNFGWNAGGSMGIGGAMNIAATSDHARRMVAAAKRRRPACLCFVEGGPIVLPRDAITVCDAAKADGYIGGSTLDRLPLEMSVMQTTSAFKAASMLRQERWDTTREQSRIKGVAGLIGPSEAMTALVDRIGALARTELSICITGEPGAGKTTVARAIHVASRSAGPFLLLDAADPDIDAKLFGLHGPALLHTSDGHLVIENVERLSATTSRKLLQWIERGIFERFRPQAQRAQHPRLILTTTLVDPAKNTLVGRLAGHVIEVPPLRARLEDITMLSRAILATQKRSRPRESVTITADGMRQLLRHGWPGNVRELATVLAQATALAPGGQIDGAIVRSLLEGHLSSPADADSSADERVWIAQALARHRFRRGEAAVALGLSRKTLYNKMKRLGLS